MIDACPELLSRVSASKSRDGKNTINLKTFPGGVLRLTGANSAAGLRAMPAKILILDEVDGYPPEVGGEGNPVDLAIARTSSFEGKKKILIGSTPINLSVDKVLNIAKTITTLKIKLPVSGETLTRTMLLTAKHKTIEPLFNKKFWENF